MLSGRSEPRSAGLGARRLRVVLPLPRPCRAGTTPFLSRGSLCRFAGRTWGAGCGGLAGGLAGDRGQQGWCSDCCLVQNRGRDPRPDLGLDTLIQIRGRGPSSRSRLGTLLQIQAGDPPPDPGWGPSSRSRPRTRPWAAGPSCQEDLRPDPASLSAQRARSQG